MINATDTAKYSLETVAGGYVVVIDGIEFTSALPFAKAVDCVRRCINGDHFADIAWDMLDAEANDEIAALLGFPTDISEDNMTETTERHVCDEQAERTAYRQYVSDGIGDTDGWYVPESFEAWRAHFHRGIGHTEPRTAECTLDECHAPQHEKVRVVQHIGMKPRLDGRGMRRGVIRNESICLDCAAHRAEAKALVAA